MKSFIIPSWPAPDTIKAYSTTRHGGFSCGHYASFNLGLNVGDEEATVLRNRHYLSESLELPNPPCWLQQIHSPRVVPASSQLEEADASYTALPRQVCIVQTGDCLPILLCDRAGKHVAAIHAGWRGMVKGVIQATLAALALEPSTLLAWLGPAISGEYYEVGPEVYEQFLAVEAEFSQGFKPSKTGRWLLDLNYIARLILMKHGVNAVFGGEYCTYNDSERFFSYRRDNTTGRMVSLIWIA